MADRYAELRAALNLDLPPLPWHAPGLAELHDADDTCVACFSDCEPVEQERRPVPSIEAGDRFARYVAAANKETVCALLAGYDRMRDALVRIATPSMLPTDGDPSVLRNAAVAALAQEQGESDGNS